MKALEVLAQTVKLRREQLSMTQAELAVRLANHGMVVDPTAVVRIEQGERAVRIDQLLALAVALETTPAHLLAPPYARTINAGGNEISAAQVLAWFAGDPEAAQRRRMIRFEDLDVGPDGRRILSDVLEEVEFLGRAIERKDRGAVVWAATRAHNSLSAMVENTMTDEELRRIWADYNVEGDS